MQKYQKDSSEQIAQTSPRNFVFCSAGKRIRELSWLNELSGFDVGLVYYGNESISPLDVTFYISNKDFKIPNFIQLIREFPEILAYDYYFFIDDDLIFSPETLHKWLKLVIHNQLDVSQPSLTADSKADWPHLVQQKGLGIDFDQFVEVQCYCLSARALRHALPFFFMAKTGTGLDMAIFLLSQRHHLRTGVIHEFSIYHPYRENTQTVRKQYSEFSTFNKQLNIFISFCFNEKETLANLAQASRSFGDTNYIIIRLLATLRFVTSRIRRKLVRIFRRK